MSAESVRYSVHAGHSSFQNNDSHLNFTKYILKYLIKGTHRNVSSEHLKMLV